MKKAEKIRAEFEQAKGLKGDEALGEMESLRDDVRAIETAAMRDFSFPMSEIEAVRRILPEIDARLSRLKAGRKRRLDNASERFVE